LLRENPQRLAWTVLLLAFAVFCVLVIAVPLAGRSYLLNSTDAQTTAVTSVRGTILTSSKGASVPVPVTDGATIEVEEGTTVSTDATSQAILTFFNDSTLTLYGQTEVSLEAVRTPRYSFSPHANTIVIEVKHGRVRIAATNVIGVDENRGLDFNVITPDADAALSEGSFSVEISEDMTQITARSGKAQISADGDVVMLASGERSVTMAGQPPSPPLPPEQNLVQNGDFSAPLEGMWEIYKVEPPSGAVTTTVSIVDIGGVRNALRLASNGEDGLHSEVGVTQRIDKSVLDYDSLRVQVDVRINLQSLPGGGTLGSEFPIMMHLSYKDADANQRDLYHGFYYSPAPQDWILFDTPDNSSERILRFLWYPYESPNLLDSLGSAKPVHLDYVRIYASGWLYDAYVTNVALLAQD
jgi:hypothetical protein